MKVLVLTTQFYKQGGAERLGVELAVALNSLEEFKVELGSIYAADLPGVGDAEARIRSNGICDFHYLSLEVNPSPVAVLGSIWRLRKLLKKARFDIVETSQITPCVIASWAAWGLKTQHVAGVHDVFSRERYNSRRQKFWRFSVQGSRCAKFYAISNYVKKHWIEYSKTPPDKTQTVLNAIPHDCFDAKSDRDGFRDELGVTRDSHVALFVGRMLKRKGIDTALDAVGPILRHRNLHLVYVGDWEQGSEGFFAGEDSLREEMIALIAKRGWRKYVHFLGRREDVPRIMASSDLLVHPARIEGFGLVLAEAMAAGLPVVASTVQGIPEVVAGSDAILVPPDDPDALRLAVLTALNRKREERDAAIVHGRARAEAFRIGKRIEALKELFKNLTSTAGAQRSDVDAVTR